MDFKKHNFYWVWMLAVVVGSNYAMGQGWFDMPSYSQGTALPSACGAVWGQAPPPPITSMYPTVPTQTALAQTAPIQYAMPQQNVVYPSPQVAPEWASSPPAASGVPALQSARLFLDANPRQSYPLAVSGELGAIFLNRSGAAAQQLAFDGDGGLLLDASDLDSGLSPGGLVKLGLLNLRQGCPIDLQFESFWVNDIGSSQVANAESGVVVHFFGGIPVTPEESETIDYLSSLSNVELNLRYRWLPGLRLLAGARYFQVSEQFDMYNANNLGAGISRIGFYSFTNNKMLGGQVGAESTFWHNDLFGVYGSAKYAFLHNFANGQATALDAGGGDLELRFKDDQSANLLDIELGIFAAISKSFGAKVGYRGLLADRVAIAPDQSDNLDIFNGTGAMSFSRPEWHGLFVSLEGVF